MSNGQLDGNKLICTPGGNDATLVALEKGTGELIWKAKVPGAGEASQTLTVSPARRGFGERRIVAAGRIQPVIPGVASRLDGLMIGGLVPFVVAGQPKARPWIAQHDPDFQPNGTIPTR